MALKTHYGTEDHLHMLYFMKCSQVSIETRLPYITVYNTFITSYVFSTSSLNIQYHSIASVTALTLPFRQRDYVKYEYDIFSDVNIKSKHLSFESLNPILKESVNLDTKILSCLKVDAFGSFPRRLPCMLPR